LSSKSDALAPTAKLAAMNNAIPNAFIPAPGESLLSFTIAGCTVKLASAVSSRRQGRY
jgi:hypothetical protein